MADDGRIVVVAAPPPRMHPQGERAQLIGRCLDRIDAEERRDFGRSLLRHTLRDAIRPRNRRQRRRPQRHLDPDMRTQTGAGGEQARIEQIGPEELVFVTLRRLAGEDKPASVRAARTRLR
jgi:hypothetical protein